MDRRAFLSGSASLFAAALLPGCRGRQVAHVLQPDDPDMVGSHTAGGETWKPLMTQTVSQLLNRHVGEIQQAAMEGRPAARKRICFVGVENRSIEEIGDFQEQIYEHIDTMLSQSEVYQATSRRFVEAGLSETRLRPDELFIPRNMQLFAASLERMEQPIDYLLFAKITSGTTRSNKDYQRDYLLTLEMVNIQTGEFDKESATLRKGYHKSALGKLKHYDD